MAYIHEYKPTGASETAHADVNLITKTATIITAKLVIL